MDEEARRSSQLSSIQLLLPCFLRRLTITTLPSLAGCHGPLMHTQVIPDHKITKPRWPMGVDWATSDHNNPTVERYPRRDSAATTMWRDYQCTASKLDVVSQGMGAIKGGPRKRGGPPGTVGAVEQALPASAHSKNDDGMASGPQRLDPTPTTSIAHNLDRPLPVTPLTMTWRGKHDDPRTIMTRPANSQPQRATTPWSVDHLGRP